MTKWTRDLLLARTKRTVSNDMRVTVELIDDRLDIEVKGWEGTEFRCDFDNSLSK